MQEFQERVVIEKNELDYKLNKLSDFIMSDDLEALPNEEQARMAKQAIVMIKYSKILGERIDAFI